MYINIGSARLFFDVVGESLNASTANMSQRPTLILLHGGPAMITLPCVHILTDTPIPIS